MILVTGGAGFIGSVLVKELNRRGRGDIFIVDRLEESEKWKNLKSLDFLEYIHADDLFVEENRDILENITYIFHMGAISSTTEKNVDLLYQNNTRYSQILFRLATDLKIPIIYASSAATYGDGNLGYSDEHEMIPALRPMNAYGFSKNLMDEWVFKQKDVPPVWFGLKFFNVFGPNEYHKEEMRSLVAKAYEQISSTGKVKLFKSHKHDYKDGWQLRDFVYIRDVVDAMMALMDKTDGSGIYNMGTGKARSFFELVDATFKSMGKETKIEYIDMPGSIRNQYQYYTQADMSKFSKLIPEFKFGSLEDSVADYVLNYLSKEDPFY
jgi:ADP-L-glycero-D-manno-heptose 6-epimerase